MSAIIIIAVLIAAVVGIAAAIGAGPLVLVIVPIGIALAGWAVVMGLSRRSPGEVAQERPRPEFLGPGGQDDPDR